MIIVMVSILGIVLFGGSIYTAYQLGLISPIASSASSSTTVSSIVSNSSSINSVINLKKFSSPDLPGFSFEYDGYLTIEDKGYLPTAQQIGLPDTLTRAIQVIKGQVEMLTIRIIKNPSDLGGGEPRLSSTEYTKLNNNWYRIDLTKGLAPNPLNNGVTRYYYKDVTSRNDINRIGYTYNPYLFDSNGLWITVTASLDAGNQSLFDTVVSSLVYSPKTLR
jgi:hypothetical protein